MISRLLRTLSPALGLLLAAGALAAPTHEIKFASIAPEGSTWNRVMQELDEEVREATGGEVGFRIYAGGVQGDEPDMLRKLRFGQIHAAGFTGNGMGEILPASRVLELPFLYKSKQEIDFVLNRFTPWFDEQFREQGYELLGWTEVGYVYFFSVDSIRTNEDLKGKKVWAWQGDPLAKTLMDVIGISPVMLSLPEVLTALQTGMVEVVYTVPMAAVSLQWFTRVNYMNLNPLTNTMGAVVADKRMFDRIPEEHRRTVIEISRRKLRELTELTREDNREAIETLEQAGITLLPPPPPEEMEDFRRMGREVRKRLVGDLIPPSLLERVMAALEEYRASGEARE